MQRIAVAKLSYMEGHMKTLYTAHAKAIGGRDGHASTDDKRVDVELSRPGSSKPGTNPEQLFACGYAACFGSAVQFVAQQKKLTVGEISVASEVMLNQDEQGFSIAVMLDVTLTGMASDAAKALVREAHTVCPYSKATRGNIPVALHANGEPVE
jgi:osmotically inducible protein OsmC